HFGRLHQDLLALGERVRTSVAEAIGHAVAGVARQVVLSMLGKARANPTTHPFPVALPSRPKPLWQRLDDDTDGVLERNELTWCDERPDWELPDDEDREEELLLPSCGRRAEVPPPGPWRAALAIALQAVGWWLWRQAGRWPVRATLGFGLACALAM